MRNTTVLISGASVAGPALAYWLNRYGFQVTVVEKAPALRSGGQAIDFTGSTHMTVLQRMGILADIEARQTGKTDMSMVDADGRELAVISGDFTGGDIEILRGDLAEVMYKHTAEHCEYLFGDTITALADTAEGVHVEFAHAPARTFDLVFGCDGIHSRVRKLAFGPERDFVSHKGYYYCIAGVSRWESDGPRERAHSQARNAPGRLAVYGGSKAAQMYMFASPELDYSRDDFDAQRRIVAERFADMGWRVPEMLAELPQLDGFYLDSISQVKMKNFVKGRVALLGDAGYGNTLAGFGTGLAIVGAYVLAGELAVAGGDHTVAFARYEEMMKRYCKLADGAHPGRFLAPKTGAGIRFRNWFLGSRFMEMMMKSAEKSKDDIELKNYPEIVGAR
ncbi:FAD-dependent monooxygenase [Nocardia huaxiensis]|uniref:FAD-dependent monooxygenase n=1 Tax=Nocardia huaxiensis TaxID=2755382 RepID=A0A7D6ZQA3_9NOCA|nr:FAD-dependent monooxygenase [Nocardia huaxiensis]QLY32723.1 FAD-dependent monooxygenase [Nocardia huaxiensis]UFS93541.1 FAD-dependent monooxygenase [Nocardia huaxiensis]